MRFYQRMRFHGILLYRKNYREHDQLIKFFTAERGKKMFLVQGANRPRFKMSADLLPFTYGIYKGSLSAEGLSYLMSSVVTHHYFRIIREITLNAYATYIMNLLDAAFPDGRPVINWFNKLFFGLRLINAGLDPEVIAEIFAIQLLPIFGVAPHLKGCAICGRHDLPLDYSEKYGGLICRRHWGKDPYRFHLSPRTVFDLQRFSVIPVHQIHRIHVEKRTKLQLRLLLTHLYHDSVGFSSRSQRFLAQLRRVDW